MKKVILASASPRRSEILKNLNIQFEVKTSDLDESKYSITSPAELVQLLSYDKARKIQDDNGDSLIIAADTVVAMNEKILGKPKDEMQAFEYLKQLSGKTHEVYTGITILDEKNSKTFTDYCVTKVIMREISDQEIYSYINSGEPFDKAGAYAIQGLGAVFVKKIEGDYFNVVGLPVSKLIDGLKVLGYDYFSHLYQ